MAFVEDVVRNKSEKPEDEMNSTRKETDGDVANRRREPVSSAAMDAMRAVVDNPPSPSPELLSLLAKHRRSKAGRNRR